MRLVGKIKMNRIREMYISSRLQTKLGISFSILAILIAAMLTYSLYLNFSFKARSDIRKRLCNIVEVAALQIDGDLHSTLASPAQEGSPAYIQIRHVLQRIRDTVPDIRFIYTWRRNADGKLIFIVDAETDPNQISHLGDVYTSGEPAIMAKLAVLNHADTDEDFNSDQWGTWLSGYAPFYKLDGQMEGILGMDIKASNVLVYEREFLWKALAVFLATIPLTILMGLLFGRKLADPVVKLTQGSEHIAQGDLSHRVSTSGSYEINILSQTFNKMAETLQKAIVHRDEEIDNRKKAELALGVVNKDLKTTVEKLTTTNRELKEFAHITTHDLKTPLRGIGTLAEWLVKDYADKFDDEGRKSVHLMMNRVNRLYRQIDNILWYSEIGCVAVEESEVDLNKLIEDVTDSIAPAENVKVIINGQLPTIVCEQIRMKQVFQNLISNAVKYIDKPAGLITIGCTDEGDYWKFSVTDNGPGIEERYFEKIFRIFQTLATKEADQGTGMGLAIVKKIVESYGGRVWVESKAGQGSTFAFTLPKQRHPQEVLING